LKKTENDPKKTRQRRYLEEDGVRRKRRFTPAESLHVQLGGHSNWVRLSNKGQLKGAGDKPVSPEQMELARLRTENARLCMERDILGKATAYFAKGLQ
jgi:hypothetical protein